MTSQRIPITTFKISGTSLPTNLEAHYHRLKNAASYFGVPFKCADFASFLSLVQAQQKRLNKTLEETVVRISLSPESLDGGLLFDYRPYCAIKEPLKLQAVTYERPDFAYKYSDYYQEDLLRQAANAKGCDDILKITTSGLISESSFANVFMKMKSGQWVTPAVSTSCCLAGTTRGILLDKNPDIAQVSCPIDWLVSGEISQMLLCNAVNPVQIVSQVTLDIPPFEGTTVQFSLSGDLGL